MKDADGGHNANTLVTIANTYAGVRGGRTGAVLSLTEDPTLRSSPTVIDLSRDEHKQPEWLRQKLHEGSSN
ncbi:hypothetical protein [Arthrobacter sp. ISL-95]|uniref:hypothetical protein n=1 Tax=Arthrobacter sp. ISL-95 TaxID=2819116 RepID=UPI001BE54004|nr:hypothetical protein [Arthrobacter sp. ISL-95]MBT2584481.1 hypothetical protein [Arthrobacter sp. ISL-95]